MGSYAMTGGATGIGAAIKQSLRNAGHNVVVADIKDADILGDLSNPEGREKAIAAFREHCADGLDGLITCAGVAQQMKDHAIIASLNYFGSIAMVEGLEDLLAKNNGNVVLISSNSAPMCGSPDFVDALLGNDEELARKLAADISGHDAYSGSKQAVARWMKHNCAALAVKGIRINAVAPGYIETPMTQAVADDPEYGDAIKQFVASIPLGRPGQPEDIANLVDFVLSDKGSFICGALLYIDGGHDAMMRNDAF
ncbi:MAG: SDR family oxidoreductase [Gammaproteobacteria bacterium]|nr:SDR family oxidoreductase [Gammaproteobacteria bacterium]NNL10980.1 SDR family oxidoreductase [Pseudomonadales bacterium]